jgi:hypothetical protein
MFSKEVALEEILTDGELALVEVSGFPDRFNKIHEKEPEPKSRLDLPIDLSEDGGS